MKRKRVLFHLPVPIKPESYDGTQGRVLGMLNYFRDRDDRFAIDAISANNFGTPTWNLSHQQEVLKLVDNVFIYEGQQNWLDFLYSRSQSFYYQKLLRQQLPVDSDYATPPGYIRFFQQVLAQGNYDVLWINNLDYAHLATSLKHQAMPKIIDIHDITSDFRLVRKNIEYSKHLRFEYEKNFKREVALLSCFDSVIIDSQRERNIMSAHLEPGKIHFLPHLARNPAVSWVPYFSRKFEYDLLFVGAVNQPNKDGLHFFLNSVFPKILQARPETKLAIAGKISSEVAIESCVAENVDCLGYVFDLSDLYLKSRIVICPLVSGSGTKFKLVEAMSYGMPIVTTQICASALSLIDGENSFVADDPAIFAEKTKLLLSDVELATDFSERVFSSFEQDHSIESIYSRLDYLFDRLIPDPQEMNYAQPASKS